MLNNETILITGGTGSFGNAFVKMTYENFKPKKIIIFSRDEMKQWNMSLKFSQHDNLKFIIGDVRDKDSLLRALNGVTYVVHAAATKIVPTAEYNPFECIKTNVIGAMNLIDACEQRNVKKVIALSTDKASNPINLYGASKLAADKLFVASTSNIENNRTIFSVVRYGNVMGSRGSVIPFFISCLKKNEIPITDLKMTRFMIPLEEAVKLVWLAFKNSLGGEIYVKKIPSMKIIDIAKAISENTKQKVIGIRPGEKVHEQMIGLEDAPYTFEYKDYYKILPALNNLYNDKLRIAEGKKVPTDFVYSSEKNSDWMTISELKLWIEKNNNEMLKIS